MLRWQTFRLLRKMRYESFLGILSNIILQALTKFFDLRFTSILSK